MLGRRAEELVDVPHGSLRPPSRPWAEMNEKYFTKRIRHIQREPSFSKALLSGQYLRGFLCGKFICFQDGVSVDG